MSKRKDITPTLGHPEPPAHVTGEALNEWARICDELDAMGTLTTADRGIIAMYVTQWARWVTAEQQLAAHAVKQNAPGEIVAAPKTKVPMFNPWVSISNGAHDRMQKLLAELGLSPAARAKLK